VSRFAIPRFPIYHHFGRIETDKYRATGEVLAASSRRMGLTQQEFAKQLGNPQSFVSQYESGQHQVDAVELVVVADTPGIKPVDLFSEVGNTVKQWVRPARQRWHVRVDDAGRGSGEQLIGDEPFPDVACFGLGNGAPSTAQGHRFAVRGGRLPDPRSTPTRSKNKGKKRKKK
jgi:hypothetical protein